MVFGSPYTALNSLNSDQGEKVLMIQVMCCVIEGQIFSGRQSGVLDFVETGGGSGVENGNKNDFKSTSTNSPDEYNHYVS